MVHVVATIRLKPGCRDEYLEILNSIVSDVRGEKGCLTYGPTIDKETDIEIQEITGENTRSTGTQRYEGASSRRCWAARPT